MRNANEAVI